MINAILMASNFVATITGDDGLCHYIKFRYPLSVLTKAIHIAKNTNAPVMSTEKSNLDTENHCNNGFK